LATGDADSGGSIGSFTGNAVPDLESSAGNSDGNAEAELHRGIDSAGNEGDPDPDELVTYKDDSALRDQQSTGRKRAAKAYPLDPEADCEWRMRKNCGGGQFPIVGCMKGKQQARHHGPDKNTLNNERGNVHRICHQCHNRWHTLNDPDYVWGAIHPLHEPYEATIADIGMNEVFWDGRRVVKAKD
jgi:hypothetical protein